MCKSNLTSGRLGVFAAVPITARIADGVAGDKQAALLQLLGLYTALTPERRNGHWIHLHNLLLLKTIGRGYAQIVKELKNRGIIEVNERYSTGTDDTAPFTMSYRFTRAHRHGRTKLHFIESAWSIARATKLHEADPVALGPAGLYYRGMFDRFTIDHVSAANDPKLKGFWAQWTIGRFASGHEFGKRCEHAGRYHCLMTQLPRLARRYITTDEGEPTVVVDISACQPLLLGHLAMLRVQARSLSTQQPQRQSVLLYGARFRFHRADAPKDVQHWLDLCETREIYTLLCREVQSLPGNRCVNVRLQNGRQVAIDLKALNPAAFKRACLIPLFDTVAATIANPVFHVMVNRFPTIARYVLRSKAQRYQDLAYLLQRAESELMIDRLGESLERDYPREPIQPIHDALLVRHPFADDAIAVIKDQFATVGLFPQVKMETVSALLDTAGTGAGKGIASAKKATPWSWFQDMTGNRSNRASDYFNIAV